MKRIFLLACLSVVLGACGARTEKVKDFAFTRMANTGNQYCKVRDPAMAESVNAGANRELRENGAEFDVTIKVNCDE